MNSETSLAAEQYRLQKWAAQIRDCQNRPENMGVTEWCSQHGLTKANYYYRLRRVRKACLDSLPDGTHQIVPVEPELLQQDTVPALGLDICMGACTIHVSESSSMHLLASVLEVLRNA